MTEATDVTPTDLQRDLDQIKEAMGIVERDESAPAQWLLFGGLVALGAALSQYVVLNQRPGWWHALIWIGVVGVGGTLIVRWRYDQSWQPGGTEPNVGFQILVAYLGAFVIQLAVAPVLPELGYLAANAYNLGIILVMLGLGFVVAGETLKAYRIRARDRRAFHAGGLLLIVLGVAIPNVELLHMWGYATFGGAYLLYSLAAYAVLTRT